MEPIHAEIISATVGGSAQTKIGRCEARAVTTYKWNISSRFGLRQGKISEILSNYVIVDCNDIAERRPRGLSVQDDSGKQIAVGRCDQSPHYCTLDLPHVPVRTGERVSYRLTVISANGRDEVPVLVVLRRSWAIRSLRWEGWMTV